MYEPVCKPVRVFVYFHIKVEILRFTYNNHVYKVTETISKWQETRGKKLFTYFTLACKEDNFLCELQLDHTDLKWMITHKDTLN